jgi:hypothetical protein
LGVHIYPPNAWDIVNAKNAVLGFCNAEFLEALTEGLLSLHQAK